MLAYISNCFVVFKSFAHPLTLVIRALLVFLHRNSKRANRSTVHVFMHRFRNFREKVLPA